MGVPSAFLKFFLIVLGIVFIASVLIFGMLELLPNAPQCTDSDPANGVHVRGFVESPFSGKEFDSCVQGGAKTAEVICTQNGYLGRVYSECPQGESCVVGACVQPNRVSPTQATRSLVVLVVDKSSGLVLVGASVQVKSGNSIFGNASSSADGLTTEMTLDAEKNYVVEVTKSGYYLSVFPLLVPKGNGVYVFSAALTPGVNPPKLRRAVLNVTEAETAIALAGVALRFELKKTGQAISAQTLSTGSTGIIDLMQEESYLVTLSKNGFQDASFLITVPPEKLPGEIFVFNAEMRRTGNACVDADHDNYFTTNACGTQLDCDDSNPAIQPGATETCDGVDNNCNAQIDEGCPVPPANYSLTYWGPSLDIPSETQWNNDFMQIFEKLKNAGFSHVGIHGPYLATDPSQNPASWNLFVSRASQLRGNGYKIALHFSPGRILKNPNELDPQNHPSNGQNLKYFDSTGFSASQCNGFANPCEASGLSNDPAYGGIVWQKELQLLDAFAKKAKITANDLVLINQEIWGGNLGWCKWGTAQSSGFYLNGPYPHLLENSVQRYTGPQGQPAYQQEGQFISYLKQRGADLLQTIKNYSPNTPVFFYGENPVANANQACYRGGDLCPCLNGQCAIPRSLCPLDEIAYMPVGAGNAPSPSLYFLPNLAAFQQELGKGNFSGSFVWLSFSTTQNSSGTITQQWDPLITQKAGKILRDKQVGGIIIYPGPFEQNIPADYYLAHAKALANGFLQNQDPGPLTEKCNDGWDNDGDGLTDEAGCV